MTAVAIGEALAKGISALGPVVREIKTQRNNARAQRASRPARPRQRRTRRPPQAYNRTSTVMAPNAASTRRSLPAAPLQRREVGQETIGTVASAPIATAWYVNSFSINPGESDTFARLSSIAQQYQKYACMGISFDYTPNVSTSTAGTIYMGFAADSTTLEPTDSTTFMGLYGAIRGPVWAPLTIRVPTTLLANAMKTYLIKAPTNSSPQADNIQYSVGRIYLAVSGVTATNARMGEVGASYNFMMHDPRINLTANMTQSSLNWEDGLTAGDYAIVEEASSIRGSGLYFGNTNSIRRRGMHPSHLLIIQRYTCDGGSAPEVNIDEGGVATTLTPSVLHDSDTLSIYNYWIPAGRVTFTVQAMTTSISFRMIGNRGAQYEDIE